MLVGDSHATARYPAFRKAAEERGWTLYFFGKSACPVVDVAVLRAGTPSPYAPCATWREHLLDRLEGIDGLDAVVIGRGWPTGAPPSSRTARPAPRRRSGRCGGRGRSARSTGSVGSRCIVVMEDVPWPNVDVPACLSEHPRDVEACGFSRVPLHGPGRRPGHRGGGGLTCCRSDTST